MLRDKAYVTWWSSWRSWQWFLFKCLKSFLQILPRTIPWGAVSLPSSEIPVWYFSALTDEFVAEKPLLKTVTFQGDVAAFWSWLLDSFLWYIYLLSNLLMSSRILFHMLIDAVSEVWWLHLFLKKKLGATPVLVWTCWDGTASAGGVRSAVSYWVYPWTGIEELGFSFGSAPDFSGWLHWHQFLSLWFNFRYLTMQFALEK